MGTSSEIIIAIVSMAVLLLLFAGAGVYIFSLYLKNKHSHINKIHELQHEFQQTLLAARLETQEQTLDHFGKELHANFSHLVSLININLSEILIDSSDKMKPNVVETKLLAKQLLSEMKALSASLNSDHIAQIGFVKAFDNELGRICKAKNYHLDIAKLGKEYRMSPEYEIILFRICQEVLNNIAQYSMATDINIIMDWHDDHFSLRISDNGIGFDMDEVLANNARTESTGILNIRKRALMLNAEIHIDSKVNKGTSIHLKIPRNK